MTTETGGPVQTPRPYVVGEVFGEVGPEYDVPWSLTSTAYVWAEQPETD